MKSTTLNLLKKEILLGNTPQTLCWLLCCVGMAFIPSYPLYVGPFYITLAIMMTFAMNQSSHDILYTVLLPVRKIDTVKARFLYCGLLEVLALLFALLAALIRNLANFPQNQAGIGFTPAYFGLQMIVFSVFNSIFLGNVYKNPLKPGLRYLGAAIMYFVTYAICELPVWVYLHYNALMEKAAESQATVEIPLTARILGELGLSLSNLTMLNRSFHLTILLTGTIVFALSWLLTFRRSAKQFEKYDL